MLTTIQHRKLKPFKAQFHEIRYRLDFLNCSIGNARADKKISSLEHCFGKFKEKGLKKYSH